MRRYGGLTYAAMLAASLCAGCAQSDDVKVAGAILTDGAHFTQGKRVAISQFGFEDTVVQLVDFTWPDPQNDGGRHRVVWNWYRDGKLVSRSGSSPQHDISFLFNATPYTLRTARAASTLGAGNFEVDTLVDGNQVAASHFTIVQR